jgi:hypothetical protein
VTSFEENLLPVRVPDLAPVALSILPVFVVQFQLRFPKAK